MTNRHRGEVSVTVDGVRYRLCLTLGTLAELEAALGAESLSALGERFGGGEVRASDLLALIGAALRGGGHALDEAGVAALPLAHLEPLTDALGDLLTLTFGPSTAATAGGVPANPPSPQEA
ncbi:MAG TPA: gene transfer agent family protein [Beijerinckiaceae bacterium]|jgi:hypothetical protein